jgi:hypothetical protein
MAVNNALAYWSMDTDGTDDSGNGNTLTVTGATNTTAKLNNGYSCDGSNDYLASKDWSSSGIKSIAWWGYIDSTGAFNGNTPFFSDIGASAAGNWIITRIYDAPSQMIFNVNGSWNSGPLTRVNDTWKHYGITLDGVNARIYIDAVLTATIPTTDTNLFPSSSILNLGGEVFSPSYSKVRLDEMGLYSQTLLQADMDTLYNGGVGFNPYASTGYPNKVNGVASASIGKVNGVATADISKVNGS